MEGKKEDMVIKLKLLSIKTKIARNNIKITINTIKQGSYITLIAFTRWGLIVFDNEMTQIRQFWKNLNGLLK